MKLSPRTSRRIPSSATLGLVTVLGLGAGLALRASAETAVDIASRTGEIIGAASACRMEAGDLLAVGYTVIGWARDQARTPAELKRARAAHEAAVRRGVARIEKQGPGGCPAAVATFRDLQRKVETSGGR
jgi:hypothetical protein